MVSGRLSGATDIVKHTRQLAKQQAMTVRVVGLVQDPADKLALGTRLAAHSEAGEAVVRALGPKSADDVADADLALVVVREPEAAGLQAHLGPLAARRRHTLVVVIGRPEAECDRLAARMGIPAHMIVLSPDGDVLPPEAGDKAVHMVGDRRFALGAAFPVFREAGVREAIKNTAWQNAAVATVLAVPGADMPVLTANQIKMVLQIAAIHGETIGFERAKEILAVIGSGLVFRTAAREALGLLPGLGWVIKGGVAYAGTVAVGKAAERYFGLGPEGRAKMARNVRSRAGGAVEQVSRRRLPPPAETEG